MSTPQTDPYILGLEREKRELLAKIDDLRKKIRTIDALIIKARTELLANNTGVKVTRKNADRLFFETLILEVISKTKNGARTAQIYAEIGKLGYSLNYNTLRSYIIRLRDTKRIKRNRQNIYNWIVSSDETSLS
jgi:hypothetical protein